MKKDKTLIVAIFLVLLISTVIYLAIANKLPQTLATHFDAKGNPNGYMSKVSFLLFSILFPLAIALTLILVPYIDPLKKNIEEFKTTYLEFILVFVIFMEFVNFYSVLFSMGIKVNINYFSSILFAVILYSIGILLERAKRNWFIGIRTPWTLSSDAVWEKTHKIGGKLFKIASIISLFSILFKDYYLYFILVPLFAVSIYLVVFSYFDYKKEQNNVV